MSATPEDFDKWSTQMGNIYNSLEGEIIRKMIELLEEGTGPIEQWQLEKMRDLGLLNRETVNLIADVSGRVRAEVEELFKEAGREMVGDVDKELPYEPKPLPNELDR